MIDTRQNPVVTEKHNGYKHFLLFFMPYIDMPLRIAKPLVDKTYEDRKVPALDLEK
jgi:hypothetical protein